MIAIDTVLVQSIAADLVTSGQNVLELASTVRSTAAQVNPSKVGQNYREFGDRLALACTDTAAVLTRWGASIDDCASALNRSVGAYRTQERDNTASIAGTRLNIAA
ncbi:hypothetical protein [Nocardia wallacei]|uniref:hypothetical protein n=1 Tax=Nocardia wallacei TaxID=480035 RepID=UPI0024570DEA|nr:hypothetical protein [Nocardia wallacei]